MQRGGFKSAVIFAVVVFGVCPGARAQQIQQRSPKPGGSAEGTMTVTATVVSSVGVVVGPDGQQQIIIANAADPKDSAPNLALTKVVTLSPSTDTQHDAKPEPAKQQKRP